MPWNVLLFPLIGGYLFVNRANLFRYRSRRCEGERLLLECAFYGTLSLILARLLVVGSHSWEIDGWNVGVHAHAWLHHFVPDGDAPYLGTGLSALVVAFVGSLVVNLVFWMIGEEKLKRLVLNWYSDDGLMLRFHDSMYEGYPLSITLTNRKVYIGWMLEPPSESPHDRFFTLMLLLSGYREEETLRLVQTVNYADRTRLADDGTEESLVFTIMLKIDDVVSVNPFDQEIYEEQFVDKMVRSAS